MTQTSTFAVLEIPADAWRVIAGRIEDAGQSERIDKIKGLVNLSGLALRAEPPSPPLNIDDLWKCYKRSERFPDEHCCPRGAENGRMGQAVWGVDDCCTYCGSLHPELLMERIEAGTVELGPTDKNYKVYVNNRGGAAFKQTYRGDNCPGGNDPKKWIWTTRDIDTAKFYFQHFSVDQRKRFVELLNQKKLNIGMPGHFYRLPFFCVREN